MISIAVTGVEISCSIEPRSHSRAMVSDVRNAPMTDMTSASTPGIMKALLSRSSLNQVRVSTLIGAGRTDCAMCSKPVELNLRRVALYYGLRITHQDIGGVVVGASTSACTSTGPPAQPLGEVPGNHDAHLGVAVIQRMGDQHVLSTTRTIWKYSLAWNRLSRSWLCWLPSWS